MKRIFLLIVSLFALLPTLMVSGSEEPPARPDLYSLEDVQTVSLVLDGVQLTLLTPFLPNQTLLEPAPDDPIQVASIVQKTPRFSALTLTAIPYGAQNSAEIFSSVQAGNLEAYQAALRAFRQSQGDTPQEGPTATLFGQEVTSILSTVFIHTGVFEPKPVQIAEWVFEAGQRLWVLRISQEIPLIENAANEMRSQPSPASSLNGIQLTADNLEVASTSLEALDRPVMAVPEAIPSTEPDLPFPHWWDGDCDENTYYAQTGMWSYPLGAQYRGVKACGPRPVFDDAPHAYVRFNPGWYGVLEWECVELSMRFLYLAYGVPTYSANGNEVVTNYSGDTLIKINDGTPGFAPQPNDVLSLGPETPWGHTSVIITSNVDQQGNGTISVLEENASPTGTRNYNVVNWHIQSSYIVIGWLHDPLNDDITPPIGDLLEPLANQTIQAGTLHLEGWATDDDSGLASAQFIASYDGGWRQIGPSFSDILFSYDWDWCAEDVPNGPITLALLLTDQAGNQNTATPGLRGVIKDYACPITPNCTPDVAQVALFEDPNYAGDCQVLGTGSYSDSSTFSLVGDDNTESILVGANVMVSLYTGNSYQGRRETLAQNDSNLSDNLTKANTLSSLVISSRAELPAVPSHLWPANMANLLDDQSLSLTWQNEGGATQMRASLDGPSISQTTPWGEATSWSLGSLSPGIYSWQIQARNDHGESAWSDWHFFTINDDGSSPPASLNAPYLDTLEGNTSSWRATGLWHLSTHDSYSTTHAWWYGQDATGNYDTGTANDGSLTTPPIVLPVQMQPYVLTFWTKYETENQAAAWDQRRVQISVDSGAFKDIYQLQDDPMNHWLSASIDLSPYYTPGESHTIQVRFYYATLDSLNNGYKGWFLDDIQVQAQALAACSDPYEPNNLAIQATPVSIAESRDAAICPGGDIDFYTFSGSTGDQIVVDVDARTIGSSLDALVTLLDSDGKSILALHDDEVTGIRQDPHLGYRLPRAGTYFLKIQAWDHPMGTGIYHFSLLTDPHPPVIQSFIPASGAFLPSGEIELVVQASDALSGISHVEFLGFADGWSEINQDWDGSDGWRATFNTAALPEGKQLAFYARVYDWAGNSSGVATWDVILDFTNPDTSAPALPDPNQTTAIHLTWAGTDNLSGIRSYHVRSQKNSDDWVTTAFDASTGSWWFVGAAGNLYTFRIRATDNAGNIEPYLEGAEVHTTIPAMSTLCSAPDAWDGSATVNDNTASNATLLNSTAQTHNFCNPAATNRLNDVDWFRLPVSEGHIYTVSATPQHPSAAVVIELYATDGTTLLQVASPNTFGTLSSLTWMAGQEGNLYLKLNHLDGAVAGNAVAYQVSYQPDTGSLLFFPIIQR